MPESLSGIFLIVIQKIEYLRILYRNIMSIKFGVAAPDADETTRTSADAINSGRLIIQS